MMITNRSICMKTVAILVLTGMLFLHSCQEKNDDQPDAVFEMMDIASTGIDFENTLRYSEEFNVYIYKGFYNGSGVGLGDLNNDGLLDIVFSGNQVDNQCYLNKGDFKFEDVTAITGLASPGVWSTGVSIIDINGDGKLDIYVCKAGKPDGANRHNELFINQGNNPEGIPLFKESARNTAWMTPAFRFMLLFLIWTGMGIWICTY